MKKFKPMSRLAILLVIFMAAETTQAQWFIIKRSLQAEVRIARETATHLILRHQALADSIVVTSSKELESDIYGDLEVKRGGNPYRIWVATEKLLGNSHHAEGAGEKFFRASFLRTLRHPIKKPAVEEIKPDHTSTSKSQSELAEKKESTEPLVRQQLSQAPVAAHTTGDSASAKMPVEPVETKAPDLPILKTEAAEAEPRREVERKLAQRVPLEHQASPLDAAVKPSATKAETDFQATDKEFALAPPIASTLQQQAQAVPSGGAASPLLKNSPSNPPEKTELPPLARSGDKASPILYVFGVLTGLIVFSLLVFAALSPMTRARIHLWKNDYVSAAQIYENVLAKHPQRFRVYPPLANLYLLMGRKDEAAMEVYKAILQLNLPMRHRERIDEILGKSQPTTSITDSDLIDKLEKELKAERRKQSRKGTK